MENRINVGDIVCHFKREYVDDKNTSEYLYKVLAFASHTESGEKAVELLYYFTYNLMSKELFMRRKYA